MISYDDFAKLEIRIGEITAVGIVPDADKLLKLTVDFGDALGEGQTTRQIISGIRTYFDDPQVLVGRQCPFLTNLEYRTIRGLESQGMILAASYESELALLDPSVRVPNGTRIK